MVSENAVLSRGTVFIGIGFMGCCEREYNAGIIFKKIIGFFNFEVSCMTILIIIKFVKKIPSR